MQQIGLLVLLGLLFSLGGTSYSQSETLQQLEPAYTNAIDGTLRRIDVPILMYHYVSDPPPDADTIRQELSVSPDRFRSHLQALIDAGYSAISLYDLYYALMQGRPLPVRPVVLTFDDGHIDHYSVVYPMLREFDLIGTFFIITGRADQNDPAHLSWAQIREMAASGMSMEAHSKTHSDLRNRDFDFLVYEILGSLESLSTHTGRPAAMFAYP
ncbi:polysaccharide deacetylase family protein [bacterium]|nr:polysaccharide deacetylase family protein [bacterium]